MSIMQLRSLVLRHHVKRMSLRIVLALACSLSLMSAFGFVALDAPSVHAAASQEELWVEVPQGTQSLLNRHW